MSEKLIKEYKEKIDHLLAQVEAYQDKIVELEEKKLEKDDNHVKIICRKCNGKGWVKKDEKKVVCDACKDGYLWAELYDK